MKKMPGMFFTATVFLALWVASSFGAGEDLRVPLVIWSEDKVIAIGQGVAPDSAGSSGSARLMAKRAAVLDLKRNLLEFLGGVLVQSTTTVENFMTDDNVRSSVEGSIKGVSVEKDSWDGRIYTVTGSMPMKDLRRAVASSITGLGRKDIPNYTGQGFDRLVLDLGEHPFKPSMVLTVTSYSGKPIYGASFMDKETFVEKGAFVLKHKDYPKINESWLPSAAWAAEGNPLVISGDILVKEDGSIMIPDETAKIIESNEFDFRIPCKVTVISKAAAVRGYLGDIRVAMDEGHHPNSR